MRICNIIICGNKLDVPQAKSRCSIKQAERPRLAASLNMPAPVMPPPITSRSHSWTPCKPPMVSFDQACFRHSGTGEVGELERIPGTNTLWVELRWASRAEAVMHLEDLLLRRTRLGVLLPQGGAAFFARIRLICQKELGWDDDRWQHETLAYKNLWQQYHSVP